MTFSRKIASKISLIILISAQLLSTIKIAKAEAVAKGCGDVSIIGLEKIITKPVILITLAILNGDDFIVQIPINRIAKGQVGASANASGPFSSQSNSFPGTGKGNDPAKPNSFVGTIFTPPNTTAGIATPLVKASVFKANSEAQASISSNIVVGNTPGSILGISAATTTACSANAFIGRSASAAAAGTDPFILDPLTQITKAVLTVDLLSNTSSDPNAGFGLSAYASPDGSASASFTLNAVTNIPGLPELFNLNLSLNSDSNQVNVSFLSPLISSPISSQDFDTNIDPLLPGYFLLNPNNSKFSIPFYIPAGTLGEDEIGQFGLALDIFQSGTASAAVPEPSFILSLFAFGTLGTASTLKRKLKPSKSTEKEMTKVG